MAHNGKGGRHRGEPRRHSAARTARAGGSLTVPVQRRPPDVRQGRAEEDDLDQDEASWFTRLVREPHPEPDHESQPDDHPGPHPLLVERVAASEPGVALDAGCGDGSDALWLAAHGWRVHAVDASRSAVERGAVRADEAGVVDRIVWEQQDPSTWAPERAAYDLVSAQFLHLPDLAAVHGRLAAGVRRGGTLLIVLHAPPEPHERSGSAGPDTFRTAAQVGETLGAGWDVATGTLAHPPVAAGGPRGADVVVQATRR